MADRDAFDRLTASVADTYGREGSVGGTLLTFVLLVCVAGVLVAISVGLGTFLPGWAGVPGLVVAVGVVFVGGAYLILEVAG